MRLSWYKNLFVKMFIVVKGEVSDKNIVAQSVNDLENNSTEEAKYVNKMFQCEK